MKKNPANTKTIILSDGDLPSLLVAAMEAERLLRAPREGLGEKTVQADGADALPGLTESRGGGGEDGCTSLLPWPTSHAVHEVQVEAARSHAGYFGLDLCTPCVPWPGLLACHDSEGKPLSHLADGLNQTLELVSAVYTAIAAGATRVVWPIHFQSDTQTLSDSLDAIAAAVDKALLIGRLGLLEHHPMTPPQHPDMTIDTPLVDLTSSQLADLVVDMDVPVHLAWWCRSQPTRANRTGKSTTQKHDWLDVLGQAGWIQTGPVTIQSDMHAASARKS